MQFTLYNYFRTHLYSSQCCVPLCESTLNSRFCLFSNYLCSRVNLCTWRSMLSFSPYVIHTELWLNLGGMGALAWWKLVECFPCSWSYTEWRNIPGFLNWHETQHPVRINLAIELGTLWKLQFSITPARLWIPCPNDNVTLLMWKRTMETLQVRQRSSSFKLCMIHALVVGSLIQQSFAHIQVKSTCM